MDIDPASILAMRAQQTQQLVQIAVLKKSHEMEMSLVNLLDQAVRSAPAPQGQGMLVDKHA
ncbi:MAG TPA: hypothetical protein VG757_09660 [Devosia sp.]|nr:hypothetical protein [Devosia sp.]